MNKPSFAFWQRVKAEDKINFTRHLSIVIKAGLPLLEGLRIIRRQTTSKNLGRVIDQVIANVNNGQFLATSLEKFPYVFDSFFVNIVRVGEVSGNLWTNLAYLSEELKKARELRGKMRSAMIYPMIVMMVMITIVGFLVFFVFPKVIPIFQSLKVSLPLSTRILIFVSESILNYWIYMFAGLILVITGFWASLKLPSLKYFVDAMVLRLPVFGRLSVEVNSANFCRVVAMLLKSGVRIVEAIEITSKTFTNSVYRKALEETADEIRKGEQLVHYLGNHKTIFPPLLVGLIEIGESTGNLEENLNYLANYYVEEVETRIKDMTVLLEPLLLLVLGLVVGFVAVSIILPIYQITQGVK